MESNQITALVTAAKKFLKAKGVTKEEVINLIDQIAEDGQIDAAEAADLKRQVKAINCNTAVTITTALIGGSTLVLEILHLLGVI